MHLDLFVPYLIYLLLTYNVNKTVGILKWIWHAFFNQTRDDKYSTSITGFSVNIICFFISSFQLFIRSVSLFIYFCSVFRINYCFWSHFIWRLSNHFAHFSILFLRHYHIFRIESNLPRFKCHFLCDNKFFLLNTIKCAIFIAFYCDNIVIMRATIVIVFFFFFRTMIIPLREEQDKKKRRMHEEKK